jgi:hypothetical protein
MRNAWVDVSGLDGINGWMVSTKHGFGATQVIAMGRGTIDDDGTSAMDIAPGWSDILAQIDRAVEATRQDMAIQRAGMQARVGPTVIMQKAYGFPCRAMYWNWDSGVYVGNTRLGEPFNRAIALPQRPIPPGSRNLDEVRALPTAIIPIGFVMNTLVYAAALWLLFFGAGTVKRSLRRHRNRCPACGYDLRGTQHEQCPECGGAITGRPRNEPRAQASGAVTPPTVCVPNGLVATGGAPGSSLAAHERCPECGGGSSGGASPRRGAGV